MTRILITGGRMFDPDGDMHDPPFADILIEGDTIAAIMAPGGAAAARSGDGGTVIAASDRLVIPGEPSPKLSLKGREIRALSSPLTLLEGTGEGRVRAWLAEQTGAVPPSVRPEEIPCLSR